MRKVLFPVSRSEVCRRVFDSIASTSAILKAELILMHVLDPVVDGGPAPGAVELSGFEPKRHGCERYRRVVGLNSDPAEHVTTFAGAENVDCIMLPVKKRSVVARLLRRTALKIFSKSPCAIWAFKEEAEAPPKRLLCAITSYAPQTVSKAAELARSLRTHLMLVYVVPEIHEGQLAFGFDDNVALSVESAAYTLKRITSELNLDVPAFVETGSFISTAQRVARSHNADLLVIERSGPTSVAKNASHLHTLALRVHCPTLAI